MKHQVAQRNVSHKNKNVFEIGKEELAKCDFKNKYKRTFPVTFGDVVKLFLSNFKDVLNSMADIPLSNLMLHPGLYALNGVEVAVIGRQPQHIMTKAPDQIVHFEPWFLQ